MPESSNAILIRDGKALIGKRPLTKKCYAGLWDVFGGHVEDGETPEETVKREIKEELGIEILQYKYLTTIKNDVDPTSGKIYNHHFFVVTKWKGEIEEKNLSEIKQIRWVSRLELKDFEFARGTREILFDVLENY